MLKINIRDVYFCNTPGESMSDTWWNAAENNFKYFVHNDTLYYCKEFEGKVDTPFEFDYSFTNKIQNKSQIIKIDISQVYWNDKFLTSNFNFNFNPVQKPQDLIWVKEKGFKYVFHNGIVFEIIGSTTCGYIDYSLIELKKGTYIIDSSRIENYK